MTADRPFDEIGDLVEELLPIATNLVQVVREEGPDAVRGALLQMRSIQESMTTAAREKLAHTPGAEWGVLAVVLAGMVDPEAGMRQLLDWSEPLKALDSLQREQQRLRDAGVTNETAAMTLAKAVAAQQTATPDRMLRIVHSDRSA